MDSTSFVSKGDSSVRSKGWHEKPHSSGGEKGDFQDSYTLKSNEQSQHENISDANNQSFLNKDRFIAPWKPVTLYFSDWSRQNEVPVKIARYMNTSSISSDTNSSISLSGTREISSLSHEGLSNIAPQVKLPSQSGPFSALSPKHPRNEIEIQNPEDFLRFNEYVPMLRNISKKNFPDLLIRFLKEHSRHIPLSDFYNLIYTPSELNDGKPLTYQGATNNESDLRGPKLDALYLCRLIIETLKSPHVFCADASGDYAKIISIPCLNVHEIFRVFLSMKIVWDTIKRVHGKSRITSCICRDSIHKTYYILCKKLIKNNPIICHTSELQSNVILNKSQFGRVMRLVFPNIKAKRLGQRGESKYHYQGTEWKLESIDEDTRNLATLSWDDINKRLDPNEHKPRKLEKSPLSNMLSMKEFDAISSSIPRTKLSITKPLHSFVDISHTFASRDFSLRVWEYAPDIIPQQSQWSMNAMYRSIEELNQCNVRIGDLILRVQNKLFSAESVHYFLQEISVIIFDLMEVNNDAYLHLFLIVSLLFFPVCFASEKERIFISRDQLSHSLTTFVNGIESKCCKLPSQIQSNCKGFSKIIQKLISSIRLFSSRVPTSLARQVSEVITDYPAAASNLSLKHALQNQTKSVIQRAIVTACYALNWEFLGVPSAPEPDYQAKFITEMTTRYMRFISKSNVLPNISAPLNDEDFDESTYELSFQLFVESTRVFHEWFLSDELISKLPVRLIELMMNSVINEFQTGAFYRLGSLNPELSKEVYKTWWVYSAVVQEHMSIISEVVALSQRVAKPDVCLNSGSVNG